MNRIRTFSTVLTWALYAYVLFLPLALKVLPLLIGILIISLALSMETGGSARSWRSWTTAQRALLLSMPLYYIYHLIGLFWSTDMDFGLLDIGIKVSLLLVPLILLLRPLPPGTLQRLMRLFVFGLLLSVAWNLLLSTIDYWKSGDLMAFQRSNFSHTLHIGYYAMYLLVGIAILIHGVLSRGEWRRSLPQLAAIAILAFAVILTASKMGAIILVLLILVALIHYIRSRGEWERGLLIALGLVAIMVGVFFGAGTLKERMVVMWDRTFHSPLEPESVESTMARRMTWAATWDVFESAPFLGTGTGDIKNELVATYEKKGFTGPAEKRLNTHDQYLQSYAALGLVGGSLLLFGMLGLLILSWRSKEFLAIGGGMAIAFSLITESILEVQAGVLFVGMMMPLLVQWMAQAQIDAKK